MQRWVPGWHRKRGRPESRHCLSEGLGLNPGPLLPQGHFLPPPPLPKTALQRLRPACIRGPVRAGLEALRAPGAVGLRGPCQASPLPTPPHPAARPLPEGRGPAARPFLRPHTGQRQS